MSIRHDLLKGVINILGSEGSLSIFVFFQLKVPQH